MCGSPISIEDAYQEDKEMDHGEDNTRQEIIESHDSDFLGIGAQFETK